GREEASRTATPATSIAAAVRGDVERSASPTPPLAVIANLRRIARLRARSVVCPGPDVLEVGTLHVAERSVGRDRSVVEVDRPVAELLEQRVVVTGRNDDTTRTNERPRPLLDDRPKLVVEGLMHFVKKQDAWLELLRDGEAEPRTHALRICRDRILER